MIDFKELAYAIWGQVRLKSAGNVGRLEARQELLLHLESKGGLESEGILPLGTAVFSLKVFN